MRGISMAVLLGLVIGTAVSAAVVWLRPVPTGIAHVELIELHRDRSAGPSWVVELEADRTGYPFLIHLDEAGRPSLLFPDGPVTEVFAGEKRTLPDATGQRAWRSPGGEIFVALSGTPYVALDRVLTRTEQAALGAGSLAAARRAAREALSEQLGPGVFVDLPKAN